MVFRSSDATIRGFTKSVARKTRRAITRWKTDKGYRIAQGLDSIALLQTFLPTTRTLCYNHALCAKSTEHIGSSRSPTASGTSYRKGGQNEYSSRGSANRRRIFTTCHMRFSSSSDKDRAMLRLRNYNRIVIQIVTLSFRRPQCRPAH